MQTELTANRIRGCAVGAMFFAGFGSGWWFTAFAGMQKLDAGTAIAVDLGTLALLAGAVAVMRQAKHWPRVPSDPKMMRTFAWVNAMQWAAIAAVVFGFLRLHIGVYMVPAITAIAGLHLFPLARLFRYPMHHVTGALLVGWGAASCLLFSQGAMQGASALGTGAILWASAAVMLLRAMRAMAAGTAVQRA